MKLTENKGKAVINRNETMELISSLLLSLNYSINDLGYWVICKININFISCCKLIHLLQKIKSINKTMSFT